MRFGLLSDVHGNLTALRAAAAALARAGPLDRVIVAGDLLQGGPRPREVWEELVALGWTLIRGNEDDALVADPAAPGHDPYHPTHGAAYRAGLTWTRQQVGPEVLAALAALPFAHREATPAGDLLVVHSSPRSTTDMAGAPHNTAAEVAAAYGGTGAAAIAFGHYHESFVRPTELALLVNVASVGLTRDGRPLAAFTVLSTGDTGWTAAQRHVPYDPAEERHWAERSGQPPWVPDEAGLAGHAPREDGRRSGAGSRRRSRTRWD